MTALILCKLIATECWNAWFDSTSATGNHKKRRTYKLQCSLSLQNSDQDHLRNSAPKLLSTKSLTDFGSNFLAQDSGWRNWARVNGWFFSNQTKTEFKYSSSIIRNLPMINDEQSRIFAPLSYFSNTMLLVLIYCCVFFIWEKLLELCSNAVFRNNFI